MTEKKVTPLDKVSSHPFTGETVYFATKHGKEVVVAPLLAEIDLRCTRVAVDTDQFGTFSGEVERAGGVNETLRRKIAAAAKVKPEARFLLASEGSFGPHPFIGLVQSDHEAMLFVDRKLATELYVEEISTETNNAQIDFRPGDDLQVFLKEIGFPKHGVIVKPTGPNEHAIKGLVTLHAVEQAINDAFRRSLEPKVTLSADMRANFNPTRMKIIGMAGKKLLEALRSLCPGCQTPGFKISKSLPGLACEACGAPSRFSKEVILTCVKCEYVEQGQRPDGIKKLSASECEFCNP